MTSFPPPITTVQELNGSSIVAVRATQLGSEFSERAARQVVDEWVEFLASGPSDIRRLAFTTRTPRRLFEALKAQTQLEELHVKWGDYADLAPLAGMEGLRTLSLGGAGSVDTVEALGGLVRLQSLSIEGFRSIEDNTPLGRLSDLRDLELGGDWVSPRNGHLGSIRFLETTPRLENLLLHTVVVDDKDYSPLLSLRELTGVRVMAVRGMHPPIEQLKDVLPWKA